MLVFIVLMLGFLLVGLFDWVCANWSIGIVLCLVLCIGVIVGWVGWLVGFVFVECLASWSG